MTTSTHYVLIDANSGFVWGDAYAENPIAACREVDENFYEFGRIYEDVASLDGQNGYDVYEAPEGFAFADGSDGATQDCIDQVEAFPFVTRVAFRAADE